MLQQKKVDGLTEPRPRGDDAVHVLPKKAPRPIGIGPGKQQSGAAQYAFRKWEQKQQKLVEGKKDELQTSNCLPEVAAASGLPEAAAASVLPEAAPEAAASGSGPHEAAKGSAGAVHWAKMMPTTWKEWNAIRDSMDFKTRSRFDKVVRVLIEIGKPPGEAEMIRRSRVPNLDELPSWDIPLN